MAAKRPPSEETLERLQLMISDGYSLGEIRRTLHMNPRTIKKYGNNYAGLTPKEGAAIGNRARLASLKLARMNLVY